MNITNFQLLSLSELEKFWSDLDIAIEEHSRWLNNLNRTLFFNHQANVDDISNNAHQRCYFGRWFQSQENQIIMTLPSFMGIGKIHKEMHDVASELLKEVDRGGKVDQTNYEHLVALSEVMRAVVYSLKREIKNDISTISMLLIKVFEYAAEGVMITTADATILNVNKSFSTLMGYSHHDAVGESPNILFSGRHDDEFYSKMWHQLKSNGYWVGEIWNRKKGGELFLVNLTISALTDNNGNISHYIGIFTDINSESENQGHLYRLAHYDALTELPNRVLFYDRLRHAISIAKREKGNIAVLFIDLDGFKVVNDRYGHKEGDNLLKQVSNRINACLRESDTVSRFGGDEFTVVLPDIGDEENLNAVTAKINAAIEQPYCIAGNQVHITTSIGSTVYPKNALSADILVRQADLAMYAAKRDGKNRSCRYTENMG